MAIYGNEYIEEARINNDYISNHFLNAVLDEKAQEYYKEIEAYRESGEGQFEIAKKLIELTDKEFEDFDNLTKEHIIESYFNAYNYRMLLEYSGNPEKNEEFKQTLQDLDRVLVTYIDIFKEYDKYLRKATDLLKACKDVDTARTAFTDCNKESRATDKLIDDMIKKSGIEKNPFKRFDQQIKKFNNKYSTIGMEEKKKFDKKLGSYYDQVEEIIIPWSTGGDMKAFNEMNDALLHFYDIMPELQDKIVNLMSSWYHDMFAVYRTIAGECIYLRKHLGIEKENGIIYKMVQKIFKK